MALGSQSEEVFSHLIVRSLMQEINLKIVAVSYLFSNRKNTLTNTVSSAHCAKIIENLTFLHSVCNFQ